MAIFFVNVFSLAITIYLGNVKVVWTNGDNVAATAKDSGPAPVKQAAVVQADDDLPF